MEVILLERIGKLGQMGDVVRVKDGFARNFLLPRGKALRATAENKSRFESMKAELQARNQELKGQADAVAAKLDGKTIMAIRQASEAGQLFGSVSTRDIAVMLKAEGAELSRSQVALNAPIKNVGQHKVPLALHPEVETNITVIVARSEGEAERIASGEDVTVRREQGEEECGEEGGAGQRNGPRRRKKAGQGRKEKEGRGREAGRLIGFLRLIRFGSRGGLSFRLARLGLRRLRVGRLGVSRLRLYRRSLRFCVRRVGVVGFNARLFGFAASFGRARSRTYALARHRGPAGRFDVGRDGGSRFTARRVMLAQEPGQPKHPAPAETLRCLVAAGAIGGVKLGGSLAGI